MMVEITARTQETEAATQAVDGGVPDRAGIASAPVNGGTPLQRSAAGGGGTIAILGLGAVAALYFLTKGRR